MDNCTFCGRMPVGCQNRIREMPETMRQELNELRSGVYKHVAGVAEELTQASGEIPG